MVALTSILESTVIQTLIEKKESIRVKQSEYQSRSQKYQFICIQQIYMSFTDTIVEAIFNIVESLTKEKSSDQEALQITIRERDFSIQKYSCFNQFSNFINQELMQPKNKQTQQRSQNRQNLKDKMKIWDFQLN
ncbi:unnamed protein product [Paramecium sonneborni]|uniref:Uncharacterized protein n=1 Tax=Paramecium sonneborni TaxID=65129 RepID=A0A8S1KDV2_9CILI|nr:unnamed protein product [Paramecium sonneborni]